MQKDYITIKALVMILVALLIVFSGYSTAKYLTEKTLSEVQK